MAKFLASIRKTVAEATKFKSATYQWVPDEESQLNDLLSAKASEPVGESSVRITFVELADADVERIGNKLSELGLALYQSQDKDKKAISGSYFVGRAKRTPRVALDW